MSELKRSARAAAEVSRINAFFPIMPLLGNRLASSRPFDGLTIGVSAHLTTLSATLVRELALGGGTWVLCAASDATTDYSVVDYLRDSGFDVYTSGSRADYHAELLKHEPDIVAGIGGALIETLVTRFPKQAERVLGGIEVSKSGVNRIANLDVPFPVVNINDGKLKPAVENRHGVGEGLWHAVQRYTGMHLSGRRVGVLGYGPVGRGVAAYARAAGAAVEVVEIDPARRLVAHGDAQRGGQAISADATDTDAVTAQGGIGGFGLVRIGKAGQHEIGETLVAADPHLDQRFAHPPAHPCIQVGAMVAKGGVADRGLGRRHLGTGQVEGLADPVQNIDHAARAVAPPDP